MVAMGRDPVEQEGGEDQRTGHQHQAGRVQERDPERMAGLQGARPEDQRGQTQQQQLRPTGSANREPSESQRDPQAAGPRVLSRPAWRG